MTTNGNSRMTMNGTTCFTVRKANETPLEEAEPMTVSGSGSDLSRTRTSCTTSSHATPGLAAYQSSL